MGGGDRGPRRQGGLTPANRHGAKKIDPGREPGCKSACGRQAVYSCSLPIGRPTAAAGSWEIGAACATPRPVALWLRKREIAPSDAGKWRSARPFKCSTGVKYSTGGPLG